MSAKRFALGLVSVLALSLYLQPTPAQACGGLFCSASAPVNQAAERIELEDGRVVRLAPGGPWPFTPGAEDAPPANAIVAQLSTRGPGTVVTDNNDAIDAALTEHNAQVPTLQEMGLTTAGGCSIAPNRAGLLGWLGLALAGLLVRRRRSKGFGG